MRYFTSAFINANEKVLKSINLTALEKEFFNFFFSKMRNGNGSD
jgi:hypothetical protein